MTHGTNREILIVGGSLTGLTFALACANRGIKTRVLERAIGRGRDGAALGIDRTLLMRTIGMFPHPSRQETGFPILTRERNATSWSAIHGWLRDQTSHRSEISLIDGRTVVGVAQSPEAATVLTVDGERIDAGVVVGADGYRSVVRAAVNPVMPLAAYAGYVLWRGLVEEREMPKRTEWPHGDNGVALVQTAGYRLIAYPVAGANGSLERGRRRISFTWYDPTRETLLLDSGCISQTRHVLASLSRGHVSDQVRTELRDIAQQIWPAPWRDFIIHALDHRNVFATPASEYFPERLHCGRVVIVGDAAHVVSPMTGRGFLMGVVDAGVLTDCLSGADFRSCKSVALSLNKYEDKRLRETQELVASSMRWSRDYLKNIGFRRSGQSWSLRTV